MQENQLLPLIKTHIEDLTRLSGVRRIVSYASLAASDPESMAIHLREYVSAGIHQPESSPPGKFNGAHEAERNLWDFLIGNELHRGEQEGDHRLTLLWRHGFCCGKISQMIAERAGISTRAAFSAGLLHDLGKIVLCSMNPIAYDQANHLFAYHEGRVSTWFAEKQSLGVEHAEIGAMAAKAWGAPENLCRIIEGHHSPRSLKSSRDEVLLAQTVFIADALCWKLGYPSVHAAGGNGTASVMEAVQEADLRTLGMTPEDLHQIEADAEREIKMSGQDRLFPRE